MSGRRKLAPANVVKVWKLDEEALMSVRMIAGRRSHPYNFAEPDSGAHVPLEDFLQKAQEFFPFAQTDVLDKWEVPTFNAESFNHYIDRDQLTAPGTLSAKTIAKLIVYCLRIMEAEQEVLQNDWVQALRRARTDAQDIVDSLAARAGRILPDRAGRALDHSLQFCAALRNPVVQAGVNNAAVHRWGLDCDTG